ncbi:MAG: type III-A CRISPR-associated protein Cas10/Csm1 [Longimicrobiales bacterium]
MLIVGDLAGIQEFVFALPEDESGAARMLRARSFFVQALSEVLAWRVQRAMQLPRDALLFCAAGKFAILAKDAPPDSGERVRRERTAVQQWLLRETGGALRYALALAPETRQGRDPTEWYEHAMDMLQVEKHRPWSSAASADGKWVPQRMALVPVDDKAITERFRRLGKELPTARWLVVTEPAVGADRADAMDLAGHGAMLYTRTPPQAPSAQLIADLHGADTDLAGGLGDHIRRPLARHVPRKPDGSLLLFENIAARAQGAPYLGVLKMDADGLGAAVRERLRAARDFRALANFSIELDDFFAVELDALLGTPEWDCIYTIFSGGDDLLLVGPWNVMLDFAIEGRERFKRRFGGSALTISGGLAVVRYRIPVRLSAAAAEELLEQAKTMAAYGEDAPKDQMSALGQTWKWRNHATVIGAGKRLTRWVGEGALQRGWLHTLLQFTLVHRGEVSENVRGERLLVSSRLRYHVARNYPKPDDQHPARRAVRAWVDQMSAGFDETAHGIDLEVVYLPAILRYALLATRARTLEDDR